MRKLLSANFARLFRHKAFWICLAAAFLMGVYGFWMIGDYQKSGVLNQTLEQQAFSGLPFGALLAVFGVLFIGDEFAFGTIRNKLVAGYSKREVYFSLLIVNLAADLMFALSYLASVLFVGIPILGFFQGDMAQDIYYALCMVLSVFACSGILTLLAMLCHHRTAAAVLGIVLSLALLVAGAKLDSDLSEPEMVDRYILIDFSGKPMEVEQHPNPLYLEGTKREIYQWAADILPTGQMVQIANLSGEYPERWPFASAAVLLAVTGIGVWLFEQKDVS